MDDFPFMINLNYKLNDFEIKPPSSLYHLKEVACSKYDLKIAEMVYVTEEEDQKPLDTEEQYFEMIDYATQNKLDQIEIIIKKNENVSEKRKESLRKRSSFKNEYENIGKKGKSKSNKIKNEDDEDANNGGNGGSDDEEVGMECDYDYFGDTRNRKGMMDENYTKQNKGFKEDKRIAYIIEKKKRQRDEDLKRNQEEEEEEEDIDKNRKRIKKEMNKNDKHFENNTFEVGPKSNKKKKKPKKDKVRF
jgi:DNA-binding protein H-NS